MKSYLCANAYVAKEHLDVGIPELTEVRGYGVFQQFAPVLQLTREIEEDNPKSNCSLWKLPKWFETNLTYHEHTEWTQDGNFVRFKTVGRGQEFIADIKDKEGKDWAGIVKWLQDIFSYAKKGSGQ